MRLAPFVVTLLLALGTAPFARAEIGVHGMFSEGIMQGQTGVHRGTVGGIMTFGKLAIDAQADVEGWTRWNKEVGTNATGFGASVGVRYALSSERQHGPYAMAGVILLGLVGGEKKVDETATGVKDIGSYAFSPRLGVGYGFEASENVTVGARFDVNWWTIADSDFPRDSPDPHVHPVSLHLGLEFIYWP